MDKIIFALGFFDGVHRGHQALLKACRELADSHGCLAGAVTFETHPETLVGGNPPALLNTIEDREQMLFAYGMDRVMTLPFDRQLMTTHWSVFLRSLVASGAAGFVCGSDFRFGSGGLGTAKKLEAFCRKQQLPCAIVPQQLLQDTRISSTHIRRMLQEGNMEEAVTFLGHPHAFCGTVVPGKQLGRTIGIPTANLLLPSGILCPRHGVYACKAIVEGKDYPAVTNVGTRPTVEGEGITIEPWLLDFDGDLYGKKLTLLFYHFLRPEQKFDSLEALQAEIQKNAAETRKYFEKS